MKHYLRPPNFESFLGQKIVDFLWLKFKKSFWNLAKNKFDKFRNK